MRWWGVGAMVARVLVVMAVALVAWLMLVALWPGLFVGADAVAFRDGRVRWWDRRLEWYDHQWAAWGGVAWVRWEWRLMLRRRMARRGARRGPEA